MSILFLALKTFSIHLNFGQNFATFSGHDDPSNITLASEYLDPLKNKILEDGHIWNFDSIQPLNILFDLKTYGLSTYKALYSLIHANYSDMFSYVDCDGIFHQSFLHCIITGNT